MSGASPQPSPLSSLLASTEPFVLTSRAPTVIVPSDGKVELKDQLICVLGDVAYEVGVECPEFKLGGEKVAGQIRVTNIYLREEDVRAQSCPATST